MYRNKQIASKDGKKIIKLEIDTEAWHLISIYYYHITVAHGICFSIACFSVSFYKRYFSI